MRIVNVKIDGYGVFQDVTLENIGPGLVVIYSPNGGGKTTLKSFLQNVLFEDPGRKQQKYHPWSGNRHHGRVTLITESNARYEVAADFAATRQNRYTVTNLAGSKRATLLDLTSHVSYQLYSSIFAIGLDDLRDATLKEDEVKSLIGGIPRVGGKKGLTGVLQSLDKEADQLYKKSGSQPSINLLLSELNDINTRTKLLIADQKSIGNLEEAVENCRKKIGELEHELTEAAEVERHCKQLDKAWEYWPRFHELERRLGELEPQSLHFPADGIEKLSVLRDGIASIENKLTEKQRHIASIQSKKASLPLDRVILLAELKIKNLERTVEEFRSVTSELTQEEHLLDEARDRCNVSLSELPADETWTSERITAVDRSSTASEQKRVAAALNKTALRLTDCENKLQSSSSTNVAPAREDEPGGETVARLEHNLAELQQQLAGATPEIDPVDLEQELEPLKRQLELFRKNVSTLQDLNREKSELHAAIGSFINGSGFLVAKIVNFDVETAQREVVDARHYEQTVQLKLDEATEALTEAKRQAEAATAELKSAELALSERWTGAPEDDTSLDTRQAHLRKALGLLPERRAAEADVTRCEAALKDAQQERPLMLQAPVANSGKKQRMVGAVIAAAGLVIAIALHSRAPLLIAGILMVATGAIVALWPQPQQITVARDEEDYRKQLLNRLQTELESARKSALEVEEKLSTLVKAIGCDPTDEAIQEAQDRLDSARRTRRDYDTANIKIQSLRDNAAAALQHSISNQHKLERAQAEQSAAKEAWAKLMMSWGQSATTSNPDAAQLLRNIKTCQDRMARVNSIEDQIIAISSEQAAICAKSISASRLLNLPAPNDAELLTFVERADDKLAEHKERAKQCESIKLQINDAETQLRIARTRQGDLEQTQQQLEHDLNEARIDYKAAEDAWCSFLQRIGLEQSLTPDDLEDLYQRVDRAAACLSEITKRQASLDRLLNRQAEMLHQLNALLAELELPTVQSEGYLGTVQDLAERLKRAQDTEAQLKLVEAELAREQRVLQDLVDDQDRQQAAVSTLFADCGAETEQDFLQGVRISLEFNRVLADFSTIKSQLEGLSAPGEPYEKLISELRTLDRPALDERLESAVDLSVAIRDSLNARRQELGRLEQQIATAEQSSEIADLLAKKETISTQIRVQAEQWMINKIAVSLMANARKAYERERQPEVTKWAGSFLSIMSGGEFSGILLNMETEEYELLDAAGLKKTVPWNRALQDQVYLALRMAIVKQHATSHEPLPIIMDDVLVNCDHDRVEGATRAVAALAKEFQVFYFTCHAPTQELLRAYEPTCDCVVLDDGKFRRLIA